MDTSLSNESLVRLRSLSDALQPDNWSASVEGRDHEAGDTFIRLSDSEDLYLTLDSGPGDAALHDLVAAARTYLPLLIGEVLRLRAREVGRT